MVYHTKNYWFCGLFPSSGILGTKTHDVSETDTVSETSSFLAHRIPDYGKPQKPSNSGLIYRFADNIVLVPFIRLIKNFSLPTETKAKIHIMCPLK
jgi:hypothetical protein